MLTTVGPCLSASSVKSGSSRPCATSTEGKPSSRQINSTLHQNGPRNRIGRKPRRNPGTGEPDRFDNGGCRVYLRYSTASAMYFTLSAGASPTTVTQ